jgi:hypothetical protein
MRRRFLHQRKLAPQGSAPQGYVLPLTTLLGVAMMILGLTAAMYVQTDYRISQRRQQSGMGLSVAEGAVDRALAQLSQRDNSLLLSRDYDPINPDTGRRYLGRDGRPNSGDEGTTPTDEWTNHDPSAEPCFAQAGAARPNIALTGTLGNQGNYRILAYRYHPYKQQGTLLVQGRYRNETVSNILVTIKVRPDLGNFPGVMAMNPNLGAPSADAFWETGVVGLRHRVILGDNANVYYEPASSPNPSLTGMSRPADPNRMAYMSSVFADATADGASGQPTQISGTLFACDVNPSPFNLFRGIPHPPCGGDG